MNGVLAVKLTLVPSLIGAITLAGRRWGPAIAGWLSAFPVVSGPVLCFIALEQGAPFAAAAATATLSAVLAILVFGICYAWSAVRRGWITSALAGFAGYFITIAALVAWAPSRTVATVAVLVALMVAPRCYPSPAESPVVPRPALSNDIWWRMIAAAVLVIGLTHFSARMGPQLSGLFAMFPVMGSILAVFSHRRSGGAFTIRMLRGMVVGYYAFAAFCLILSLALLSMSILAAFALALGCAAAIQGVSRRFV